MKTEIKVICIVIFSLFIISCNNRNTMDYAPSWHTDRGSLAHLASINDTIKLPLRLRWVKDLSNPIIGSAIGAKDNIVVGSGDTLFALNPTSGNIKWSYKTNGQITNSATSISLNKGQENRIAIVDGQGNLHYLDNDNGQMIWKINDGIGSFNSATNFSTNEIYYTKMNSGVSSVLRAVNRENGNVIWEKSIGNTTTMTPLLGFGSVFMGESQLTNTPLSSYADGTGNINWEYTIPSSNPPNLQNSAIYYNGVIDSDVNIGNPAKLYFGIGNNPARIKAVAKSGGIDIWNIDLPDFGEVIGMALTQNRNENLLIVSQIGKIHCISTINHTIIWSKSIARNGRYSFNSKTSQPVIYGNIVFQVVNNQILKAFNLITGNEVWSYDLQASTYASPIIGGKSLYIGTEDGKFYAFSSGE